MDSTQQLASSESPRRPRRWLLLLSAGLAAAALFSALIAPSAGAAEPVSEFAAAAGSTVETMAAPPPSPEPAPTPVATPDPPPAPVAAPEPAAVVEPAADAVEHSLESTASSVTRETVRQGGETVAAVGSGATANVPVVADVAQGAGETVRSAAATVRSAATAADGGTDVTAAPDDHGATDPPGAAAPRGEERAGGRANRPGRVAPPVPPPAANGFPLLDSPRRIDLNGEESAHRTPLAAALGRGTVTSTPAVEHGAADFSGSVARSAPAGPPPSLSSKALSPPGGFGPALLLLALLALLTLLAPRTPVRLLSAGRIHRSAPFICALERPG